MSKWIPAWRCVPIDYHYEVGTFENITQNCLMINNLRGKQIRIRFNNLYNDSAMVVEHAAVSLRNRVSGRCSARQAVTLNGKETIRLCENSQPWSDPLALEITPEDDLLISMYFRQKTVLRCVCVTSAALSWQSTHLTGNFYETDALGYTIKSQLAPALAADPYPNQFAAGICQVDVLTDDHVQLIGMFGDSVTHMSYFSDPLLMELYRRFPGKYAVINGGISGNRIQKSHPRPLNFPGEGHQFGIAGKDRFLRDLYDGAAPDLVLVLEGVNDCTHSIVFGEPEVPTAQGIFGALAEVIGHAHTQGSNIWICTVPPFGGFGESWRPQAEDLRCRYNELIRASSLADGIIDLDAVLRDPDDVHRMQAGMHLGDGVHPNWHGGAKMARAVLEKWFPAARGSHEQEIDSCNGR